MKPNDNKQSQFRAYLPSVLLALAVFAYAIYFAELTLTRYWAFESRALDMGNLDQAIWNTSQGRWFHLTNQQGTVNRLSLHVEPILIPISWLYYIYSGPETLLVLQAFVVALGALPLYALGKHLGLNAWLALTLALCFLLNPSIQSANWLEFHPVTLAPTFLMAAFYFLYRRQVGWYTLFAILAASCKEDIVLLVMMMGVYALIIMRQLRLGLLTVIGSMGWAYLAVFVIQNLYATGDQTGNYHWGRYGYLGESPVEMVIALLTQPDIVLAQLQSANALQYVLLMLMPVALIALLAPEILILALPSLGINLLADFSPMHQVSGLIYAAPIVPFVMLAGVVGANRLSWWFTSQSNHRANVSSPRWFLVAIVCAVLIICVTITQYWYGYLPWAGHYKRFTVTDHDRKAADIIAQIPPSAKVSAQDKLDPHVSQRETIYIFPRIRDARLGDADTIFVDVTGPAWPQHPNDLRMMVDRLLSEKWGVRVASDGYLLLQNVEQYPLSPVSLNTSLNKGQTIFDILPQTFYSVWQADTDDSQETIVDFEDKLRLLDFAITTDEHGELVTELYWQALQPLDEDYHFYVGYVDKDWGVYHDTIFYPPNATLWYPTSLWEPETPVIVQTLPWTLQKDDQLIEEFALILGVYRGGDGWETGNRLGVTKTEETRFPVLPGNTTIRLGGYQLNRPYWSQSPQADQWLGIPFVDEPLTTPLHVRFGESIQLDRAELFDIHMMTTALASDKAKSYSQFSSVLPFALTWRTDAPIGLDYSVFAHLLDSEGNKIAQLDWQPYDAVSRLPTSSWIVGQPVVDRQELVLPETISAGVYELIVGLYYWQDGQRLPVTGLETGPSDFVVIGQITID
ncbi:MAG: DUF2079 domain-containing protein [Chloroflexota bacterium]